jgi:hypothetical protein
LTPGAGPRVLFALLAFGGAVLFVLAERRSAAPLVDWACSAIRCWPPVSP